MIIFSINIFQQKENEVSRIVALDTLQTALPEASSFSCQILLDVFGSIASIACQNIDSIIHQTSLSEEEAHYVVTSFHTELQEGEHEEVEE